MANLHTDLLNTVLIELSRSGKAIAWRNEVGIGLTIDGQRTIKYGLKGSSDILGITNKGKFLAVEIKIGNDKLRKDQENFKAMIEKNNGLHFIIRCQDDINNMLGNIN